MADVNIKINVVSSGAQKALTDVARGARGAERSFDALNLSVKQGTSAFKVFLGNAAAGGLASVLRTVGRGFTSLVGSISQSTQQLETISTQFETLTGSAAAANDVVQELQAFTARTPFQFEGVAQAAQRLIAFGFEAENITQNLESLGNVAAASGADLGEISLIFGQVAAAGQLTGERLLQLQERAIPIGPALAETLGVAESAVRDLVSRGEVDFATFEQAFNSLSEEGQFAFGGIERASQTLQGRISTLSDNFQLFAAGIGEQFAPAARVALSSLTELVQTLSNSAQFDGFINSLVQGIPSAIQFVSNVFIGFVNIVQGARQAFNAVTIGFNTLAVSILDIADAAIQGRIAFAEFLGQDTTQLEGIRSDLNAFKDDLEAVAVASIESNNDIEASRQELVAAIEGGTASVVAAYKAEQAAATEAANAQVDGAQKAVVAEQAKQEQLNVLAEGSRQAQEQLRSEELLQQQLRADEDFQFLVDNLGKQEAARTLARANELQAAGNQDQALKVIRDARLKADLEATKKQKEENKRREQDRASSLNRIATLQNSSNSTLAAIGKAAALTQIAIEGPVAVTKALSAFPPPLNFAAAAAVGAAVAAQAAQVAGAFQDGGIVPGNNFSGDRVFARVNSGEMILNRQQQAELFAQANGSRATAGQEIVVNSTVELDGEVLGRSISRQVADGLELGEVV